VTIYKTLLRRGYFPKELPPLFTTEDFADFATTTAGRKILEAFKAPGNFTQCVNYTLARPGNERRELAIPHPATFSELARLTAKNFKRLLKKAHSSPISRSAPSYSASSYRAINPRSTMGFPREKDPKRAEEPVLLFKLMSVTSIHPCIRTRSVGR
jgi:hypothetical protein